MEGVTTSRAVVFRQYGEPKNVLELVADYPRKDVKETDVVIRVHAAAMNPLDWKIVCGYVTAFIPCTFPAVSGYDASGVIVQKGITYIIAWFIVYICEGSKVTDFTVGDEVFVLAPHDNWGTFSDTYVVDSSFVALKVLKLKALNRLMHLLPA